MMHVGSQEINPGKKASIPGKILVNLDTIAKDKAHAKTWPFGMMY